MPQPVFWNIINLSELLTISYFLLSTVYLKCLKACVHVDVMSSLSLRIKRGITVCWPTEDSSRLPEGHSSQETNLPLLPESSSRDECIFIRAASKTKYEMIVIYLIWQSPTPMSHIQLFSLNRLSCKSSSLYRLMENTPE